MMELIQILGVSGVLVWYLYHTTTHTIPSLTTAFREELKAERKHRQATARQFVRSIRRCQRICDSAGGAAVTDQATEP